MKWLWGRLRCAIGLHDMERLPSVRGYQRGLAGPHRCRRGCGEYWPEIEWPRPPSR